MNQHDEPTAIPSAIPSRAPGTSVVFITGAASGIGWQFAKHYCQAGWNVALFDRESLQAPSDDSQQAPSIAALQQYKQNQQQCISSFQLDISDPNAVEQGVSRAVTELGTPDLAINCAGILRTAPFSQLDYHSFKQVMDINLMGSRNFAASVLPHLRSGSHLVLVASLAGIVGTYTQAAYAASKFAVVGLAEVLRLELKPQGIDVSVLCPGEIATPLLRYERQHGSIIAKNLNAFAGVLTVEQSCRSMLKGIQRRQFMITPSARAFFTRELAKKASGLFRRIADYKLAKALKFK